MALVATGARRTTALRAGEPNTNPFVAHLLTLYSQSRRSNAGTRGMDAWGDSVYVETALDRQLLPAVLAGEFRLVLITGNAGDGKTAFLQHLEQDVARRGGAVDRSLPNGSRLGMGRPRLFSSTTTAARTKAARTMTTGACWTFLAPFAGRDAAAVARPDAKPG